MQRVAVLADRDVLPFELSLAGRVLGTATDREGRPAYEVIVCTVDGAPVAPAEGFAVQPQHDASVVDSADLVVVPPSSHHPDLTPGALPTGLATVLDRVSPATRLVSVCLASYVRAAAGRLDGRRATTHWMHVEHFARTFPRVRVVGSELFVTDGQVVTAAGASAGIDLFLSIVRDDHGSHVANEVARQCVVPPWRRGDQQQFVERPVPRCTDDELSATLEWASSDLARSVGLEDLARHAGMSRRTFTRRFRAATGSSPGQWLLAQRLDEARRLLELGDETVDAVAHRAGFGSASSLRKHMAARTGVSPDEYRRAFRR